jgi:DNA-binding CsgD family transcriptional regulator
MRASREWVTVDAVVAVALGAASLLEIWSPQLVPGVGVVTGDRMVLTVTSLVATLPLALCRRNPLAVLCVVVGALSLQQVLTTPTGGLVVLLAAMVAAYSSSAYASRTAGAVGGAVIVGGAAVMGEDLGDWAFIAIVLGGAWLVGFVVMQRSRDLRRAQDDNRELSARLALAARRLEEAARPEVAGTGPHEIADLTAREVEVTREIAQGKANAEIAADLFISEWTVKTHVANILRKLGLRDRAQVVVAAYESGLVQPTHGRPTRPTSMDEPER